MKRAATGVALAAGLALGACGGQESEPSAAAPKTPAPVEKTAAAAPSPKEPLALGRELFVQRCATCHGENGDGKGPGAQGLSPSPRDFREAAWQRSVTDQHIEQVVSYGGAAVGLSPIMPSHPDLANDPEKLAALRTFVRSLGRKEGGT